MDTTYPEASAILFTEEPEEAAEQRLEAWTPEEFDHFTDLGLLRACDGEHG